MTTTTDLSNVPIPEGVQHACAWAGTLEWVDQEGAIWLIGCTACSFSQGVHRERVLPDERTATWLRNSRLPERFRGLDFEPGEGNAPARRAARRVMGSERGLILVGPPGRGKTHLLTRIGERFIAESERRVIYMTLADLLEDIRRGWDGGAREGLSMKAEMAHVLILDDLGATKPSEWMQERLTLLFDFRLRNDRGLLLAGTNLAPEEWGAHLGERAASRLLELADVERLDGPDRRAARPPA